MTDTRSKSRPDADHPDATGRVPSLSTSDVSPRQNTDPAPTGKADTAPAGPAPAQSYAGSGTTEPVELSPETHGAHYRGPQGDI